MLWCPSVVYDEGLRSSKAIAFISSNPPCLSAKSISYVKLGASRRKPVLTKQKTLKRLL
jgi:hypothetical protein